MKKNTQYETVQKKIDGMVAVNEKYRLIVKSDENVESPREWDNVGTMVCWHRRHNLGDKHEHHDAYAFAASLAMELDPTFEVETCDVSMDEKDKAWKIINEKCVILPLYLYDHSGITMSTGRFSCPWDSGQVGWIYCTLEKAKENWMLKGDEGWDHIVYPDATEGDYVGKTLMQCAEMILKGEVKCYDNFITGNCWRFELQTKDAEGEWVDDDDSCGGFIGDVKECGIEDHLPEDAGELVKNLEWNS